MAELAKITVIAGRNTGKEYSIEDRLVVGAGRNCNLVIPGLKEEVFSIERIKESYVLKSLTEERVVVSEEGVFEKILIFGDRIKLGETELEFRKGVSELDINLSERNKNLLTIIIFVLAFLSLIIAFCSQKIAPVKKKKHVEKVTPTKSLISKPITVKEARYRFNVAEHYYQEGRLDSGNTYQAIVIWKGIVESLENRAPKLPVYQRTRDRLSEAQKELNERLKYLKNNAFVAYKSGQIDYSKDILKRIMRLVPEPTDKDYIWAKRKLMDVEK